MAWNHLGTIDLTYEWQFLPQSMINDGLVRISQSWGSKASGKALIAQVFSTPYEFFGVRSFYADRDFKLIEIKAPTEFTASGIVVRYLALKMSSRAYFVNSNWQVTVEEFI